LNRFLLGVREMQKKDDLSRPYEKWAQNPAAVRRAATKLQRLANGPFWGGMVCFLAVAIILLALFVQNFLYSETVFVFAYDFIPVAVLAALFLGAIIFILFAYAKMVKVIQLGWTRAFC
jgi:hypothetical protein